MIHRALVIGFASVALVAPAIALSPTVGPEERIDVGDDLGDSWTRPVSLGGGVGFFNYLLYDDAAPDGTFDNVAGSGFSGSFGITLPTPAGDRFYLVAGSNGCGIGP